jgi:hypothetical protein
MLICRRVEGSLGVGVCFNPLRICSVSDKWRASDANFYLITFCVVCSCGGTVVYVVYVVSSVGISLFPTIEYCGCSCSMVLC